ncbi:MAG: hypothetical protein PHC64_06350 [Candidatus Gastranaerophilales bacterium]|nr:hypothetical protein [Candidatus Gastranaerophilales bacterium]
MSLGVSLNQNIGNGIDAATLREVTQKIFQKASSQSSALSNVDLTKFNRPTLGTDLYSGKVDASTARQISMIGSGMDVNLSQNALNSLKYLSSEASKSIFRNVEGKINIPATTEITEKQKTSELPTFGRLTETADLGSDKRGSNPFYKGELLKVKKQEEKEETLNLVA